VVLVANPISGRGRADRMAGEAAAALRARGHSARRIPTRLEPTEDWLDPELEGADAMVVVGGDGAVRLASDAAIRTGVPLHHLPLGTENLFAREMGSTRRPRDLVAAVESGRVQRVDAASFEVAGGDERGDDAGGDDATPPETFLLMASLGIDSEVVHDLAERRTGSITHLSYARPIARQALTWRAPAVDVVVDGEPLVHGARGTVIVANCRQYGGRLDPIRDASMTDGRLDVVVLPGRTAIGMSVRALQCRLRLAGRSRRLPRGRGRTIEVRCSPASRVQVDGDPAVAVGRAVERLTCRVRPDALPVLVGPARSPRG
jgi:diacylglycerol kinase family enzyme